jgi:hypothetical protein
MDPRGAGGVVVITKGRVSTRPYILNV